MHSPSLNILLLYVSFCSGGNETRPPRSLAGCGDLNLPSRPAPVLSANRTARLYRANFIDASSMSRNVFFNKVLCSWDFSIASEKMASLRHNAIYNELRVSVYS